MGAAVEEIDPPWGPTGPELIRSLWQAAYLMLAPARAEDEAAMDPGLVACQTEARTLTLKDVHASSRSPDCLRCRHWQLGSRAGGICW